MEPRGGTAARECVATVCQLSQGPKTLDRGPFADQTSAAVVIAAATRRRAAQVCDEGSQGSIDRLVARNVF